MSTRGFAVSDRIGVWSSTSHRWASATGLSTSQLAGCDPQSAIRNPQSENGRRLDVDGGPLVGRLFLDHPAVAQLDDACPIRRVHFRMRDLDDRRAALVQRAEQLHDFFALRRMKVAGRL